MAATHVRVRRIWYSIVGSEQGMLGGALKLHGQTSLTTTTKFFICLWLDHIADRMCTSTPQYNYAGDRCMGNKLHVADDCILSDTI